MTAENGAAPAAGLAELAVVQPGGGQRLSIGTDVFLTVRAEWTAGAYCLLDQVVAPRFVTPPHVHERESQVSLVLDGVLGFWVDGEEFEAGPGACVYRPAGKPHALWNPGAEPVRMIEVTTPATDFQRYLLALSDMIDAGTGDPERVAAFAAENGMHFVDGVLDGLRDRHGLHAEGGFWK